MLVGVTYNKTNRTTCRTSFKDTAKQFDTIGFLPSRGYLAMSRTSAIKFLLDEIRIDENARRHSIYHTANCLTVAFPECGKREKMSKRIFHLISF